MHTSTAGNYSQHYVDYNRQNYILQKKLKSPKQILNTETTEHIQFVSTSLDLNIIAHFEDV